MRCPKCQYLSFDNGDRCRNCGYEFSLSVNTAPLDLAIQNGTEPLGPMADLALHENADTAPAAVATRAAAPSAPDTGSLELPLFAPRAKDVQALVAPATPRTPLSVRRAAPAAPKPKAGHGASRAMADEPRLALDTAEMPIQDFPDERVEQRARSAPARVPSKASADDAIAAASVSARTTAALIDLGIVGGIDAAVLYLTLRMLGLPFADAGALPLIPFISFLLLLNGSYFAAFVAASGQTIGKMAAGIRVVPAHSAVRPYERVTIGTAVVRAAAYLISAVPAGVGFLPGVMGEHGRALHDRLADTRVVKA
jgi:uncharacterized RDD family membrane protein YckC